MGSDVKAYIEGLLSDMEEAGAKHVPMTVYDLELILNALKCVSGEIKDEN